MFQLCVSTINLPKKKSEQPICYLWLQFSKNGDQIPERSGDGELILRMGEVGVRMCQAVGKEIKLMILGDLFDLDKRIAA